MRSLSHLIMDRACFTRWKPQAGRQATGSAPAVVTNHYTRPSQALGPTTHALAGAARGKRQPGRQAPWPAPAVVTNHYTRPSKAMGPTNQFLQPHHLAL